MRNLILIGLGVASLFIFNSCKKGGFKTSSDRIMGEWYFEKVKFREGGTFRNRNITEDYSDLTVEFTEDFEYIETNGLDGSIRNGIWEIKSNFTTVNGSTTGGEVMECPIYNPATGLIDIIQWEQLNVTRNRICATEQKMGGTFWYTLKRN